MNPRRINAVSLSVLALTLAQVLVVVDIVHEAVTVIIGNKTELLVGDLRVGRNVDCVVVVTVTVDVVDSHVRVVVTTSPSLVDEAVVVAGLVTVGKGSHETVRGHVL